jgi:hypothetical protein
VIEHTIKSIITIVIVITMLNVGFQFSFSDKSSNLPAFIPTEYTVPPIYTIEYPLTTYNITNDTELFTLIDQNKTVIDTNTDLTALINQNIASNTSIYLDTGKVTTTLTLVIDHVNDFQLFASKTTEIQGTGQNLFSITHSNNVTISGLTLVGTYNATIADTAIAMAGDTQCIIEYCNITHFGYDGISDLCGSNGTIFRYNTVTYTLDDGLNPGGGIMGTYTTGTNGSLVYDNYIAHVAHDGIHVSNNSTYVQVYNNTVYDVYNVIGLYGAKYATIYDIKSYQSTYAIWEHTRYCDYNTIFDCQFYNSGHTYSFYGEHSVEYNNIYGTVYQ